MGCARTIGDKCNAFDTINALESTPTGADWANLRTGRHAGVWWLVPVGFAQTERVQDWHSLDRHEDLRMNLADHAENTTCPSLANPKIPGRAPRDRLSPSGRRWGWKCDACRRPRPYVNDDPAGTHKRCPITNPHSRVRVQFEDDPQLGRIAQQGVKSEWNRRVAEKHNKSLCDSASQR